MSAEGIGNVGKPLLQHNVSHSVIMFNHGLGRSGPCPRKIRHGPRLRHEDLKMIGDDASRRQIPYA